MSRWTNQNILDFIQLYRSHECLWRVQCKEYSNRKIRDETYEELVKFATQIEPHADREFVVKKINNIRCSFRRESKKIEKSKLEGQEAVYVPKLWYYDELLFLKDQDDGRMARTSLSELSSHVKCEPLDGATDEFSNDSENSRFSGDDEAPQSEPPVSFMNGTSSHFHPSPLETSKRRRLPTKRRRAPADDEMASPWACNTTSLQTHWKPDPQEVFGQSVANGLRDMSKEQQIYAEKFMSDILFQGRLGNLSMSSRFEIGRRPEADSDSCPEPVMVCSPEVINIDTNSVGHIVS